MKRYKEIQTMKTYLSWMLLAVLAVSAFGTNAWAKPERIKLKETSKRAKEQAAQIQMKKIDLQKIEDAETRKAIREIFNYLNLQTKNEAETGQVVLR